MSNTSDLSTETGQQLLLPAPWSDAQVAQLNRNQRAGQLHPYTCSQRQAAPHAPGAVLVATPAGWRCPHCDYQQDWCHAFSATQDFTAPPGSPLLPEAPPPSCSSPPC